MGRGKSDGLYVCRRCKERKPKSEFRLRENAESIKYARCRYMHHCMACEAEIAQKKKDIAFEREQRKRQAETLRARHAERKAEFLTRAERQEASEVRLRKNVEQAKKNGMSYGRYMAMLRWKAERDAKCGS